MTIYNDDDDGTPGLESSSHMYITSLKALSFQSRGAKECQIILLSQT